MQKVSGIGGVFFRAKNTAALAQWYKVQLGVTDFLAQAAGMTVFAPFKEGTDYFPANKQWMINFRIAYLDAMMARLSGAGIAAKIIAELKDNVAWFPRYQAYL